MTGAPIPAGADAIVMVERTERDGDDGVLVQQAATAGDHVRAGGRRRRRRATASSSRERCSAPRTSACSRASGPAEVLAVPEARVGVLSTGDELREGPVELAPGQIRDSNRPMLLAMLARRGL